MVLDKQPETELEYWHAICAAEKEILRVNDGVRRCLIPSKDRQREEQSLKHAELKLDSLLIDIENKFGVLMRKRNPRVFAVGLPPGKKDYLDWWNEMDAQAKSGQ